MVWQYQSTDQLSPLSWSQLSLREDEMVVVGGRGLSPQPRVAILLFLEKTMLTQMRLMTADLSASTEQMTPQVAPTRWAAPDVAPAWQKMPDLASARRKSSLSCLAVL